MLIALVLGAYGFAAGLMSDEYPRPGWVTASMVGLAGFLLVARRLRPAVVLFASLSLLAIVCLLFGSYQAGSSLLIALVAFYSATAYGVRWPVVGTALVVFSIVMAWGPLPEALGGIAFVAVACGLAAGGGLLARRLRELSAANIALRELVEMESAASAYGAVEDERSRVARELHDILSHSLGAVVLQTSAAEHAWEADPPRAREAVVAAHQTALEAVGQLHTLLTVVREDPAEDRSAVPTVADLEGLAERTSAGGFLVEFQADGEPRPVPPAVQASVYRVAQEGIANAMKHSGTSGCTLQLRYLPESIVVEVDDLGRQSRLVAGTQLGLVGIRERASLFGGRMQAGPRPAGGWSLSVEFPT
ncbi:MAG: histidine kinase [Candidatus Nanopelagicales bacterium]